MNELLEIIGIVMIGIGLISSLCTTFEKPKIEVSVNSEGKVITKEKNDV